MKKNPGARMWRSLAEYENDPEFQKYLNNEFGTPLTDTPPNSNERRRFMQLMAASFSLAGVAGCRWEQDHMLPMTRQPEGVIPGVPRYYNTAMELGGVGVPLRVKSYDGRPIKVDGNPDHPDTLGASGVYEQASVLEMYDPDRSKGPMQMGKAPVASPPLAAGADAMQEFKKFALQHFGALRQASGAGLAVLSESSSSLTVADMKQRFMATYPQAQWFEYEPNNRDNERRGSVLAFGEAVRAHYDLSKADVVLCLEADPLGNGPEAVALSKGFAKARDPEAGKANRLWIAESSLSPTGIQAEHRFAIKSAQVAALAVALEAELAKAAGQSPTQPAPSAKFLGEEKVAKMFAALVKDLTAARGKSAVLVGPTQPAEVHALGHRINALLGNVGSTVSYTQDSGAADLRSGLSALVKNASSIKTLVILGGNPVYTASGDVDFASVLKGVGTSVHLSLYRDETSRLCTWHIPLAHYLESWGDSRSYNGSLLLQQPLIAPLFQAPSIIEFLALLTRDEIKDGQGLVRRAIGERASDDKAWRRAVHDGGAAGSVGAPANPTMQSLKPVTLTEAALGDLSAAGALEITFQPDAKVYDGRFANNGWLQELPDPAMKLTWDNAAYINPKTAAALGVEDCHIVTVSVDGRSISLPALMSPAQAPGSIRLTLGYGRTHAGVVGGAKAPEGADPVDPVGVSVYPLRSVANWDVAQGAKVTPTGAKFKLATTQDKHPMDDIGRSGTQARLPQLVRQDTFANFKKEPDKVKHAVHHPPLLSLWNDPVSYEGYKWGMTIDLNRCSGCAACVVACNSENNIPVVGKEQVLRGREMHWMRIDRYFQGENADEPAQVHNQPVLCQHCEHAPCEQVCPVGATMHSSEGLNDMVYNRCIGTRYCSNNCPYKVRRFNYFNFTEPLTEQRNEITRMAQNPEVTLRFRGVMEKCSFCVQRIQAAKIVAKNARRKVKDGEITVACQDACATDAIQFGDLNDKESKVARSANSPRGYALLEELNIRPRVTYLARITNPHPDLAPAPAAPHGQPAPHAAEGNTNSHG